MQWQFEWYGAEAREDIYRELRQRVAAATYHLQGEIIERVSGQGSGQTYDVPGTNRTYTASAPGQPPAVLFGLLKNSIKVDFSETQDVIKSTVGVRKNVPYAMRLEFGFIGRDVRGRMYHQAPRPFFKVTYEHNRQRMIDIMQRGV